MEALKQQPPSQAYSAKPTTPDQGSQAHCHVVSTYQATTGDPKTDREAAQKRLNAAVAQDYLARPPQARAHTLIIAYTNKERDGITQLIRKGLQREGRLDTQDYRVTRLRGLNLERAVMATMTPYEIGLVLTITPRDYYHMTLTGLMASSRSNTPAQAKRPIFFPPTTTIVLPNCGRHPNPNWPAATPSCSNAPTNRVAGKATKPTPCKQLTTDR
jgi:hypothetical protein